MLPARVRFCKVKHCAITSSTLNFGDIENFENFIDLLRLAVPIAIGMRPAAKAVLDSP